MEQTHTHTHTQKKKKRRLGHSEWTFACRPGGRGGQVGPRLLSAVRYRQRRGLLSAATQALRISFSGRGGEDSDSERLHFETVSRAPRCKQRSIGRGLGAFQGQSKETTKQKWEEREPFSLSSSCARAGAAFLLRSWSSPQWVLTSHRKESGLGVEARCPFGNGFSVGARVAVVAACRGRSRRAAGGRRSARGTSRGPMPRADSVNALDRVHGAA